MIVKPATMCDELGCTRDWTVEVETFGQPLMAPKSSTGMKIKLCAPCAEKRKQNKALANRAGE